MGDENEEIELNLDNPIFALYLNVDGLSRQRSEESLVYYQRSFIKYSNITVWLFPRYIGVTEIKCIYNGNNDPNENEKISSLLKEIDLKSEILMNSETKEEFQSNLREMKIDGLTS